MTIHQPIPIKFDKTQAPVVAKELSWLSFNERVLQEASNPKVPVVQRLRYLGIFSNNLDEFFRVRVADVSRLAAFSSKAEIKESYNALLQDIQIHARELQIKFEKTYLEVLAALRKRKIYLVNERQLDQEQANFVRNLFYQQVLPELHPILLDSARPFPSLMDGFIYLAIKIHSNQSLRYGIVEVPTDRLPRFVRIPQRKGKRGKVFIVLDNVIRLCLENIFHGVLPIDKAEAYTFKLTLDAELELGEGINQSLINKISVSLKKRQNVDNLERFVYDSEMPEDMLNFFTKQLKLDKYDSVMPGGRYHNAKDFMSFPVLKPANLELKPLTQLPALSTPQLDNNLLRIIREKDLLVYYPYHSFDTTTHFLKTAAIDPAVKSIHISLYRVAANSRVVDALLNARNNDKEVTAVVELQARFDEAANINWATQLTDGGVNVIFGVPGLKVHAKLILVTRQENGSNRYYTHIGTGNFNEKTAKVYTDFSLFTYDQVIGKDTSRVFDFISYNYRRHNYKKLFVSPHTNRNSFERLIRREIDHAQEGLEAAITIKCNNLVDTDVITLLYRASNAGVRIRILCRGMCSLVAGIDGFSKNIEVISIVGRFLEHARVMIFHNNGEAEYYLSSADFMTRNLDFRVEVTTPVQDKDLQQRLQDIIDIQWCDNVKARIIDQKQSNKYRTKQGSAEIKNATIQSQEAIHTYLQKGHVPKAIKQAKKRWATELKQAAKKRKQALE